MTLIPHGQSAGRGSGGPPPRPRPRRSAPRADGCVRRVAVNVRRGGRAEACCRSHSRRMTTEISIPRNRPGGDVTAMEGVSVDRCHGQRCRTAAAVGAQRGRPCGMCRHGQATGRGSEGPPPRRMSALRADSCGGTSLRTSDGEGGARPVAADNAAGRPRQTSPRADGRAGVPLGASGKEGRGGGGPSLRRSAPRAHGHRRMSLQSPWEGHSDRFPCTDGRAGMSPRQAAGRGS